MENDRKAERDLMKKEAEELEAENRLLKSYNKYPGFYGKYVGKRAWLETEEHSANLEQGTGQESTAKR